MLEIKYNAVCPNCKTANPQRMAQNKFRCTKCKCHFDAIGKEYKGTGGEKDEE